ncbi:putative alpha/beta hydrolase [Myxozyma melibiosi]|uniref:Alpha/beta hydrolase n=1 Tax=Myxozyma melibiosi TaxID=54550 RepID=A0ABR1F0P0_9ASCO
MPLPFREAVQQWWSPPSLEISEKKVLSFLPFFPEPDASRSAQSLQVELSPTRMINEFEITRTTEKVENDLVILHGYGAGLAFFIRNFDGLSRIAGWRLHALDLLGYGRSSRPKFRIKAKDKYEAVYAAESWFVDSIEEWRQKRGLDKFTLMAHSMGGYVGVAYALRYPERVKKLILVSPAGVPRDPFVIHDDAGESVSVDPMQLAAAELQPQQETTKPHTLHNSSGQYPHPVAKGELKRPIPSWLVFLWERHVSPFVFVRHTGPLGPQLVYLWTSNRFSMLPKEQAAALHDYVLGLFTARGSGEYAVTRLLAPGAYARIALIDRIKNLKVPTVWMYGENDWMDAEAGEKAAEIMRKNGVRSECKTISRAGHHLYLDNPEEFNAYVTTELKAS